MHPRDVHQIGDHGAGSGLGACAFAVVQGGAYRVTIDHHGVHRAFDVSDQALGGDECGMHAQFDSFATGGRFRCVTTFRDAQELDAIAQLLGVFNIGGGERGDAFYMRFVKLHGNAKTN